MNYIFKNFYFNQKLIMSIINYYSLKKKKIHRLFLYKTPNKI